MHQYFPIFLFYSLIMFLHAQLMDFTVAKRLNPRTTCDSCRNTCQTITSPNTTLVGGSHFPVEAVANPYLLVLWLLIHPSSIDIHPPWLTLQPCHSSSFFPPPCNLSLGCSIAHHAFLIMHDPILLAIILPTNTDTNLAGPGTSL